MAAAKGTTKFRAVVAIDFGTTNTGAAYAFTAEPDDVFPVEYGRSVDVKVPTSVLLRREPPHELVAFGPDVVSEFDNEDDYLHFFRFKMQLYDNRNIDDLEADQGGKIKVPTRRVVARCLEAMTNKAKEQMKNQQDIDVPISDILWVVTVPAIWAQPAKQVMREAAVMAGMIEEVGSENLRLALEPECAALEVQYRLSYLKPGVKFMVLDCGGGTIDITVYEVKSKDPLDMPEIYKATGGGWGSTCVDMEFTAFLRELLGPQSHPFLDDKSQSLALFDLLTNVFEQAKTRFGQEQLDKNRAVNINLTPILDVMGDDIDLKAAIESYNERHPDNDKITKFGSCQVRLPASLMFRFYSKVLKHIGDIVDKLFKQPALTGIKYVLMVGGFSVSTIVQSKVKEVVADRAKVVVPRAPWLAIVMGAVRFAQQPNAISVRVCRYTYGIQTSQKFVPGTHPTHRKHYDERRKEDRVDQIFRKFTTCGEPIPIDHTVDHPFYPLYADQTRVTFYLVSSPREDVMFTDEPDVQKVGKVSLNVTPGDPDGTKITVRMSFGQQEILMTAVDSRTGKEEKVQLNCFFR